MSREGPEPVDPVEQDGVRYEALHWGKGIGLGQNGGLVRAYDMATDEELWTQKIYDIDYSQDMEPDRIDLFITSMTLTADGRALDIVDENDRRFRLDLATQAVTEG